MSLEVYLLSIPLARHRAIVPRPRRMGTSFSAPGIPTPELRTPSVVRARTGSPISASPLQRIDPA
jgi:hypothetical protein